MFTQLCNLKVSVNHSVVSNSLHQDPLSMSFFQTRILEWVAFSSPKHLPDPGIDLGSPALEADSLPSYPNVLQGPAAFVLKKKKKILEATLDWKLPKVRLLLANFLFITCGIWVKSGLERIINRERLYFSVLTFPFLWSRNLFYIYEFKLLNFVMH